jgi:uncharacterized membrane protein
MVSAGWQLVERITYASALGVPNTLISLPVFTILAGTAVAGLLGSRFARPYLAGLLGLSLFMAAFATWYSIQTGFVWEPCACSAPSARRASWPQV